MRTKLVATGAYLPVKVVRNADFKQFPINSIAQIEAKTGVKERRYAAEGQFTSDLAFEACRVCLHRAALKSEDLDSIILATSSPDRLQPATATRVQSLLGATRAFAFDLNSVCTGAVYGTVVADALIRGGGCRRVLVVGAEIYSRFLNPRDFSTCPYFGDGAGALLFEASEDDAGILGAILASDGAGADVIQVPGGGSMLPLAKCTTGNEAYFKMKGREVYDFATHRGMEVIVKLLAEHKITPPEIDFVVTHQANVNIIRSISESTGIGFEKFVINLDRYGNTAAASVPIALDEHLNSGNVSKGALGVLAAFGGGLSWGAVLVRL